MKIELKLNDEASAFLNKLKNERNELVLPVSIWEAHIRDNPRIKVDETPIHIICGDYVITEREYFDGTVSELKHLFYSPKRLSKAEGGFWFVEKLEQKKKMPKHDIFNVGLRQPGSFRSNN